MNIHLNRYNKLILYYSSSIFEGFVEKHHIIPKCMGGTDTKDNLVALPARAHFIAHYLLYKAYPDNSQLAHAFAMMGVNNKSQNRRCSSRLYELSKVARSRALKGIARPEWVKQKLRKPKTNKENYHKPKSEIHAENISKALKGKPKSDQHKENLKLASAVYQERRLNKLVQKIQSYRNLYSNSGVSKNEFAEMHDLSSSTVSRYLKGLK